ncbi:transcription termination factor MTEF18, mitochondrial [Malania oleifera]|uniref:transcription termination factor MTEF18, mitochondrial n=1 Tax=Malania oleifera TaxID=397392 RepID=UPI0025AE5166|nr:transcription termination factor MTEF18, mitochondrial [Malania oleifera]XP_057978841.1 transcription termination factor MTEF18, mitochondrial [Malania oleifera]XP_057978842.1 transcription termination factor MTEF18, mitochondrial [Malania oleifera]XP_057978843.1 transcription termination factor MTEF18, mitochondrial [Malania oleifera]XP_057978844.1 transcription termination factor MTEF18, mitochondrial [Malania oleifera]XP_057978845.1 transcription termination factor MTEF18, mitochondrial 
MRFLSSTTPSATSLYSSISCHFSSVPKLPRLPSLPYIPSNYRPRVVQEAQKVLTDYLHTTRALPYAYAEHIGTNSIFSLRSTISKLRSSASTFSKNFQKFLRYHPINEFEFFFESIGIHPLEICKFLPAKKFFFSEDSRALNAACALSDFGFPWKMLGKLYEEEVSIFCTSPQDLTARLCGFKALGFNSVSVIGICLAFPCVLSGERELGGEVDTLFDDFKRLFIDFDLTSFVQENVDAWYEVCRKIRVFYNLGCEKGKTGELMGRSKHIFLNYSEEVLVKKAEFFSRLSVRKGNVGLLLLEKPEIFIFDLESREISVLCFLKHFGLSVENLKSVAQNRPYVWGRNKMANVPHVMRALGLHEWFFDKIKNGDHNLLADYSISSLDEDTDKKFIDTLDRIRSSRTPLHTIGKLNFLHGIGFGENYLTIKVLENLHGTSCELQERFDCLLRTGIEFPKLCRMIFLLPKILSQKPETLERKVDFLCQEIGVSLKYLDIFPAYLIFDLENRIKPRYRIHAWLTEKGLCRKQYSPASLIATSEKQFIARLYKIHPAAPKHWLELFLCKNTVAAKKKK